MGLSDLIFKVAQVRCFKQGEDIGGGSGFFYTETKNLYFITNRHLVMSDKKSCSPDELRLSLHIHSSDITMFRTHCIPLYDERDGKPQRCWLEHPRMLANPAHDHKIDVVALPINEDISQFVIKSFSKVDLLVPENAQVSVGEEILVIGYPSVLDNAYGSYNLPIIRNGIIASIYPIEYGGEPKMLIDATLHTGNSGSPVVTRATKITQAADGSTTTASLLVGIFSASAAFDKKMSNYDEPLGLGIVWFASLIPEIIGQGQQSGLAQG